MQSLSNNVMIWPWHSKEGQQGHVCDIISYFFFFWYIGYAALDLAGKGFSNVNNIWTCSCYFKKKLL